MKHLVFPTHELAPFVPGGAGVLLASAVEVLARAGHTCTVLCHFGGDALLAAQEHHRRRELPNGGAIQVLGMAASSHPNLSHYEQESEACARALESLHARLPIDVVELPDYAGQGFVALRRRAELGVLADVRMVIRAHGTLELIDSAQGSNLDRPAHQRMHRMERLALRLADAVLVPSKSVGELYRRLYGLDERRLVVSPPPMATLLEGLHAPSPGRRPEAGHFLFYGKLQEVKGCDTLAEAGVALLAHHAELGFRFTFVGRDTPCDRHGCPTSRCLERIIPPRLRGAFDFRGAVPRESLSSLAEGIQAAVVPSRFETFCLAAHELRAVGLPVVVPEIPAFVDWASPEQGFLRFDGTAPDLQAKLLALTREGTLAERLAKAPPPTYPAFESAYDELFERVRAAPVPLDAVARAVLRHELGLYDAALSFRRSAGSG